MKEASKNAQIILKKTVTYKYQKSESSVFENIIIRIKCQNIEKIILWIKPSNKHNKRNS